MIPALTGFQSTFCVGSLIDQETGVEMVFHIGFPMFARDLKASKKQNFMVHLPC